MTYKKQYELFLELFPWMAHDVTGYKTSRKDQGIDILTVSENPLHFKASKDGWTLTGKGTL